MSEFTVIIKEAKGTWTASCEIQKWAYDDPMRPQERICEWQLSNVTVAGRSLDSDSMANVVCNVLFFLAVMM